MEGRVSNNKEDETMKGKRWGSENKVGGARKQRKVGDEGENRTMGMMVLRYDTFVIQFLFCFLIICITFLHRQCHFFT